MPGERLQESSGEDRHDLYALQMHVFADKATDTTSIIPTWAPEHVKLGYCATFLPLAGPLVI